MRPRLLALGAAAVAVTLLVVAMSAGGSAKPVPCADAHVDARTWRVEHERSLGSRSPTGAERLASEFVRCRRLLGMSRARVRHLLGRPDRRDGSAWLYQLALKRGILSQPEYLRVVFGPGDAVTRAAIVPPALG
jgi:hypothetical protein